MISIQKQATQKDVFQLFAEKVRDNKDLVSRWAILQETRVEYFRVANLFIVLVQVACCPCSCRLCLLVFSFHLGNHLRWLNPAFLFQYICIAYVLLLFMIILRFLCLLCICVLFTCGDIIIPFCTFYFRLQCFDFIFIKHWKLWMKWVNLLESVLKCPFSRFTYV